MRNYIILFLLAFSFGLSAQTESKTKTSNRPLPALVYYAMRDSCTQLDLVFTKRGGSLSVDGKNVRLFTNMIDGSSAVPNKQERDGFIMWVKNGREFCSGDFYITSDSTGYLRFKIQDKEFVNSFTKQGAQFIQARLTH